MRKEALFHRRDRPCFEGRMKRVDLVKALQRAGTINGAAGILRVSRWTVARWVKFYGIKRWNVGGK